jgi:hypothetical protein
MKLYEANMMMTLSDLGVLDIIIEKFDQFAYGPRVIGICCPMEDAADIFIADESGQRLGVVSICLDDGQVANADVNLSGFAELLIDDPFQNDTIASDMRRAVRGL